LLSTDLGADRIFVYRFDGKNRTLSAAEPAYEATAPGSGPRHLVFHPNGHLLFVITELTAEVWVYRWDPTAGRLHFVSRTSAYPSDYAGSNRSGSELLLSQDGRFLYVALRGDQNSVVTYAVDPQSGALREQQRIAAQGLQPWGMALDRSGHWMLVANTGSGTVDVLAVDTHSGVLSPTHQSARIPDVAAVTFADR
jgi:6-phosphogluconolactonase